MLQRYAILSISPNIWDILHRFMTGIATFTLRFNFFDTVAAIIP